MEPLSHRLYNIIERLAEDLNRKIATRMTEMEADETDHHQLYQLLGIDQQEARLIDLYQNKGRFLYHYAGTLIEKAAKLCIQDKYPQAQSAKIPNLITGKPKTFGIDCLLGNDAMEIKWRDATTDGDHVLKERTRVEAIAKHGYRPIRIMFYEPLRTQAIKLQERLRTIYAENGGVCYYGKDAWTYIHNLTGRDLEGLLFG